MDEESLESTSGQPTISLESLSRQPEQPVPGNVPNGKKSGLSKRALIIGIVIALALLIIIAGVFVFKKQPAKKQPATVITVNTQSLDAGTLHKLEPPAGTSDVKQQLTITPDTLFKNKVSVQGGLQVQGAVGLGSSLSVKNGLSVGGNTSLGGNLSVTGQITASSLSVGSLTIATIHLSGDLNISGHLVPSGTSPTVRSSVGASGGSVSISGNDTAGTITITIGNGPLIAGEMAIITFHTPFATTPKVQLTPINSASSALNYYASRAVGLFSVNSATTPTTGASYAFDYLVTQ